ncbi:hypothetical protein [Desulfonatronum thioautotrophicum]|uniref:hypothetical protein n=1 Tax=Desulfonatronum thioautotrophicum TaxID=617001 RepID=UPI0005EB3B5F|nr:hypothetical protein [Desulfonatronum thioautotrophicum]
MEKVLIKLADQLAQFDEASLTALMDKYEGLAGEFQPTKKWEQAVMVLGLIQVVRWKNHLFNYHWAEQQKPKKNMDAPALPVTASGKKPRASEPAKVLPFRSFKNKESV